MPFQIRREQREATNGLSGEFYILENTQLGCGAAIWPALGFNCIRWHTETKNKSVDWVYHTPDYLSERKATRSGVPVLVPFPNRIRNGEFEWDGVKYQLPKNDPSQKNAIHGFACDNPWRVVEQEYDANFAALTGEFQPLIDAPNALPLWPCDYRVQQTYVLYADRLRVEFSVTNVSTKSMPFGMGYHPYFHIGDQPEKTFVYGAGLQLWELIENLPTGNHVPVEKNKDLTQPRIFNNLQADDVYTDLHMQKDVTSGLYMLGGIIFQELDTVLQVLGEKHYRELVVYVPPHRNAVCIEPYTCTTDAINLEKKGIDSGLMVLEPGETWQSRLEFVLEPYSMPGQ